MKKSTISILGCGWLGLPLAENLVKKGYEVKGSTTSEEKIDKLAGVGIKPFKLTLSPKLSIDDHGFFACEWLIINIPPSTFSKGPDFHPAQIDNLLHVLASHHVKNIIYISSTSVYPENNQVATEEDRLTIENDRQSALLKSEQLLQQSAGFCLTILRCGGLMGYDRQPRRFLNMTKLKKPKHPDTPVNYIHRDDVIGIIELLINKKCENQIYNLVAPKHPSRKEFMADYSRDVNDTRSVKYKLISGEKVIKSLGYQFQYPDPLKF